MRLIRATPGSGKTAQVFREFKEALRQSRGSARLVVPTATLVRHFQHELARDGVVFPPRAVISLNRFTRELTPHLKMVPDALLRVIVRDALRRLNLKEFEQVAETSGMVSTVADTIALFDNAGATPEKLGSVRGLTPHARAFARVWREVEAQVHRCGYAMRSEILRAAGLNLSPLRIWLDGFITFSQIEDEFLDAMDARCDVAKTVPEGNTRGAPITAVSAASMERECDEIARRILSTSSFCETAVAIRDTASYLPLLRTTFERFGIPARFYFSAPLQNHPAALFLNGLVRNVLDGWEFGFALQILGMHPGWGKSAAFDRFDFDVREAMPGRGAEALASFCKNDLADKLRLCFVMDAWRTEKLKPGQWRQRFLQMAESLYRPGLVDPPKDFGTVEAGRSHVGSLRAWSEAVDCAVAFFGGVGRISLAEFWQVAEEAINTGSVQNLDERADVVHVMNVYEARQWDVDTLFVCGMTDRDFPKKNSPNLLFPDEDIYELRKAGIELRSISELDDEEQALFDSLKGRASKSLVLTWPERNAAGKSVQASRYLAGMEVEQAALCRATPATEPVSSGVSGRIENPALLEVLAAQHRKIGLTSLEDMAQCRFKFFAGKTLYLKGRPDRPEERLMARTKGLLLHKALETWMNTNRAEPFIEVFEKTFDTFCEENHLPPGYQLEVERVFLRAVARGVSATERWNPVSSEAEVELELTLRPGITVYGRVDRIDRMSDTECVIVDYKSGMTPRVKALVESTVKLQGPLYALAAKQTLNLDTIAMMYVAVREDKPFGWGAVPGADLELKEMPARWMEDARDRAIERLDDFLSGAIHADPVEVEQCRFCDFADACRYTKAAVLTEAAHGA